MKEYKYLIDTNLTNFESIITETGADERGNFLVFQDTIFYPQGGGQPFDTGTVWIDSTSFDIHSVFFNLESDTIRHYGEFNPKDFKIGQSIVLKIDKTRRLNNSKSHTAGHLLTFAVEKMEQGVKGVKGYHFPEGSYIEFDSIISSTESTIAEAVQNLIKLDLIIQQEFINPLEYTKLTGNLESKVPEGKAIRIMKVLDKNNEFGLIGLMGCGGTHLNNTGQIESFTIRKITNKKGVTRISYTIT
jgi:Ser-tRNA(Ala) deacylase AlaX